VYVLALAQNIQDSRLVLEAYHLLGSLRLGRLSGSSLLSFPCWHLVVQSLQESRVHLYWVHLTLDWMSLSSSSTQRGTLGRVPQESLLWLPPAWLAWMLPSPWALSRTRQRHLGSLQYFRLWTHFRNHSPVLAPLHRHHDVSFQIGVSTRWSPPVAGTRTSSSYLRCARQLSSYAICTSRCLDLSLALSPLTASCDQGGTKLSVQFEDLK